MRVLCVHQGWELYGSDRCFVNSVRAIRRCFPTARIDVLLPKDGPLTRHVAPVADAVRIAPLWVLRKRKLLRRLARELLTLPFALARAVALFRRSDLVYINTVTVFDFLLAARFFRTRALLHVHEAPDGIIGKGLAALVRFVGAPTIFNSQATRDAYGPGPDAAFVLHNGVAAPDEVAPCSYDGTRALRLLMLGRLSVGKGQDLLIEACAMLPPAIRDKVEIRIVGSSFDAQTALEQRLRAQAAAIAGSAMIRFEPFVDDPEPLYRWCDLVVVPSRVREGFGRVAAEATAHGRAAIVAAQGGLTEIVLERETGWLFAPGNAGALATAMQDAVERPCEVRDYGAAARRRFERCFNESAIEARLAEILRASPFARRLAALEGAR